MRQGLDWVRGRREAHTALNVAECLEAQVERQKKKKKMNIIHVSAERM